MPLFAFEGHEQPRVSPEAWIAPTATHVGDVRVEAAASIWYGAVLRADFGPILVPRGLARRYAAGVRRSRERMRDG